MGPTNRHGNHRAGYGRGERVGVHLTAQRHSRRARLEVAVCVFDAGNPLQGRCDAT